MKLSRIAMLSMLVGLPLSGCGTTTETLPSNGAHFFDFISIPSGISYQMLASQGRKDVFAFTDAADTAKITHSFPTSNYTYAYFVKSTLLNAGTVSLNENTLARNSDNNYQDLGSALVFDGSYQRWSVSGNSPVPVISDSVKSGTSIIAMYSPLNGADISRSSNLTVTWNSDTSSLLTTSVQIVPSSSGTGLIETVPDNGGSYTIPSARMLTMPAGRATIIIRRGIYKVGTASNSEGYVMAHWNQYERDVNLQ